MEKKKLIYTVFALLLLFCWLFFVGQLDGVSGVRGDINLIDEGQFGAWINHMLHGKLIYRDFFPPYGPLQVYPLYALIKLFGPSFFIIRLYSTVFGVFFGICVALFTMKALKVSKAIGFTSLIFFVLYPGVHLRSWIVVLGIILFITSYKKKSNGRVFMAGIVAAYALLQSVEAGVFLLIILLGYALYRLIRKIDIENDKKKLSVFALGFFSVLFLLSVFAFKGGWLFDYVKSTTAFLLEVSGINLPNGQGLPNPFSNIHFPLSPLAIIKLTVSKDMLFYWSIILFVIFQSILFVRFMLRLTKTNDVIVFLMLCYVFLSYFSIIGRSGHHFLYAPYVVLFASYFLSLLFRKVGKINKEYKLFGIFFFALVLGYMARYLIIFRFTPFFNFREERISNVERVAPISITKNQAKDIESLRNFVRKTTTPNDPVFFLNNLPALYFLIDRENPTKYDFPLLAISKEDRMELVGMLKKNNPIYIIEDVKAWPVDEVSDRRRLPEVVSYMDLHYALYKKIDHYLIYKKR